MKCASCQTESDGRFCPNCGAPLAGASCASCNARLVPGARFCTQCGTAARTSIVAHAGLPWVIATGAILVAVLVLMLPLVRGDPPPAEPFVARTSTGSPPPLTGTPREQADRLFNRIMEEREAGDIEQARFFVPMAVQAYQAAEPLDADGYYHLSLIHSVAGDFDAARRTAQQILAQEPDHLLGIAATAEAAAGAGDDDAARAAWQRYLDALESERSKQKSEYLDHSAMLARYEQDARAALNR
ncbi:MAG: zinc ribbon domain-containing protein [Gemmatimonadetes bacterium]|nr:zinc ribbon domain-containing protein [Gemmatimonadota bacterium]